MSRSKILSFPIFIDLVFIKILSTISSLYLWMFCVYARFKCFSVPLILSINGRDQIKGAIKRHKLYMTIMEFGKSRVWDLRVDLCPTNIQYSTYPSHWAGCESVSSYYFQLLQIKIIKSRKYCKEFFFKKKLTILENLCYYLRLILEVSNNQFSNFNNGIFMIMTY